MGQPLVVRLRHWIGDAVLGVPALRLLESAGHELVLVGKPWAGALLAGEGWPVEKLAGDTRGRIAQLRALRRSARERDPGFDRRPNAVLFPFSFGSALEARLAGLRATGYAYEGRSWLLSRALPLPRGVHELQAYWQLACAFTGRREPPPEAIGLKVAPAAREQARARQQALGLARGRYVVLCPFAGGTYDGTDKRWPEFARFAAEAATAWGLPLLLCPGPGEAAGLREAWPGALVAEGVALGVYAALLQDAALMVSNDTGPGHLAAAVGAPLLSVLGPTDAAQWGPWGPGVTIVQRRPGWPAVREVLDAGTRILADGGAR